MTSFQGDENQHPEMNEDIETNPNTPNSYKELLEIKNNFLKENPFNNYKFQKGKKNKLQSKNKIEIKKLEISSMEEFGKMLDEVDNEDPSFKVFVILVFISNLGTSPVIDQGVILSLLDKLTHYFGNNLDNLNTKLIELESNPDLISNDEMIIIKINLQKIKSNILSIKKAYQKIKDLRLID
tara:strand:+ start:855 stop:1400 length:546 start_codon:yes stop_codon:yes gene_type:complete